MVENKADEPSNKSSLPLISVIILVVFLAVVFFLYNWVSKKSKGQVVYPAGINYTGNQSNQVAPSQKPQYDYAKLATSSDWPTFTSSKGQYTFKYPKGMIPLIFPGDTNDSVSFDVADVPAQVNLMALVETVSNYDPKMVGKQEEFVTNYWKYFGGLKASQNTAPFTNEKGLKGYKVNYVTKANVVTSDNYFFFMPGNDDKVLHVNNVFPADGQAVFTRLLDSLDFKK